MPRWFESFGKVAGAAIGNGLAAAINWSITNVLDAGLIDGANKVLAGIGGTSIGKISTINARFAQGGMAPGEGNTDSLHAMLTPGEYVIRKAAAALLGKGFLDRLNNVDRYATGGPVLGHALLPGGTSPTTAPTGAAASGGAIKSAMDALFVTLDPTLAAIPQSVAGNLPVGTVKALEKSFSAFAAKKDAAMAASVAASAGSAGPGTPSGVAQSYAASQLSAYGFSPNSMGNLIKLWNQESGWNSNAVNPSSGAYGIPQALGHGHPYALGDYKAQIAWGLNYIKGRYGSPDAAWGHEVANNWYNSGGMVAPKFATGGPVMPDFTIGGSSHTYAPIGSTRSLSKAAQSVTNNTSSTGVEIQGDVNFHSIIPTDAGDSFQRGLTKLRVYGGRG